MYSGTTFTNHSGNIIGVHQKVNRSARESIKILSSLKHFPSLKQINYFEGKNGPDGIKSKSPAVDEPWHYFDPFDEDDSGLIDLITQHYKKLVAELREKDIERAAFEAAWLSHAIVDGLTPAHHHPYEQELERIRGEPKDTRTTVKKKLIATGETKRESIKRNWQLWGAKGLITTHGLFEMGVATILAPNWKIPVRIDEAELASAKTSGIEEVFARSARKIGGRFAYDEFYRHGWTIKLARWIKGELAQEMVRVVAIAWFLALNEAGMVNKAD